MAYRQLKLIHMRIDGTSIANDILTDVRRKTGRFLDETGRQPSLAIITIGKNPASESYIRQKEKAAMAAGIRIDRHIYEERADEMTVRHMIGQLNSDKDTDGIIIQRPVPDAAGISHDTLMGVREDKDVDGFIQGSPYAPPVARAVLRIIRSYRQGIAGHEESEHTFMSWLRDQHILIVGKGETAGDPIRRHFTQLQCATSMIDSRTLDPQAKTRTADILISCVGKQGIITPEAVKPQSLLISVGISRDSGGKLHGDYEDEAVKDIAGGYTPSPGGVGPVNVACLMENVIEAANAHRYE